MLKIYSPQQRNDFQKYFNREIRVYWSNIYGFDITKLDDDLGIPDGVSLFDFIMEHQGMMAMNLIAALIQINPLEDYLKCTHAANAPLQ